MPMSSPEERAAERADLAACARLLRAGSLTFHAASRFLPRAIREPATALYAFCRVADDAVDRGGDGARAVEALRERLRLCYAGRPVDDPVDRAFARLVLAHAIPRALPEALVEGLAWDVAGRRYETLEDLQAYGARVAGTVGAMMTVIMGRREPGVVARACDLGIAMQLTNIARDVGEDARMGRLYLPQAMLRAEGIDPDAFLADPRFGPGLARVVRAVLAAADELYEAAMPGIAALPPACRPGITAARFLYAGIGREVERLGYDSVTRRAVVPAGRKARLVGQALAATLTFDGADRAPAGAARFLVDAVAATSPPPDGRTLGPLLRLLALFERLERQERMRQA